MPIEKFSGKFLVRGGKNKKYDGDNFIRTVVWNFQVMKKLLNVMIQKNIKKDGLLKDTVLRHHANSRRDLILNRFWIYTSP